MFEKQGTTDTIDKTGCTILHWAAYQDNINLLKILGHMGIVEKYIEDWDAQEQTPIFKALYKKNEDAVNLFFQMNCDTNVWDKDDLTPRTFSEKYYKHTSPTFLAEFRKYEIRDLIDNSRNFSEVREKMRLEWIWMREVI